MQKKNRKPRKNQHGFWLIFAPFQKILLPRKLNTSPEKRTKTVPFLRDICSFSGGTLQ